MTRKPPSKWLLAVAGGILPAATVAAACDGPAERRNVTTAEGSEVAGLAPEARTPSGILVRLELPEGPLRAGPIDFGISLPESLDRDAGPVSVDLVSPAMPTHGVTRFEAREVSPGRYVVDTRIPMEGRWSLYVNLDSGDEAALFEFDVLAAEDGTHAHSADSAPPVHAH